ncbi:MAG: hypothetical protein ICV75_02215 [Nitrospiraceae bacterium]|nr:hypothetical protein [Nitrospiraceae bacterium]
MTRRVADHYPRLEQALMDAYRAQAEPPLRDELAQEVLREIRRQTSRRSRPSGMDWVDDLVWRTATVTVAVVVVMTVFAVGVVRTTSGEPMATIAEGFASVPWLGDE